MTTFPTAMFLTDIVSGGDLPVSGNPIPAGQKAYFQERLKGRVFELVINEFIKQQELNPNLSQATVARRLAKRPEQINRFLSGPGNWTLETLSDLLLAISGAEPGISVLPLQAAESQTLSQRQGVSFQLCGPKAKPVAIANAGQPRASRDQASASASAPAAAQSRLRTAYSTAMVSLSPNVSVPANHGQLTADHYRNRAAS